MKLRFIVFSLTVLLSGILAQIVRADAFVEARVDRPVASTVDTDVILHDVPQLDGQPGYRSAWAVHGPLDKVLIIVPGFDVDNSKLPIEELDGDFRHVVEDLGALGWDVVFFEYIDGSIDLKVNANNLARFIEYLDSRAEPDYHLAVLGGSMGGIVTRTLLVQEDSRMGIDSYVSIDSPHWGVTLSKWLGRLPAQLITAEAAHQMAAGEPAYREHYGWLRSTEQDPDFSRRVVTPIDTCAIALSDATDGWWKVSWNNQTLHNRFYGVSSIIYEEGLTSTYMPFHSTAYLDNPRTQQKRRWGYNKYRYKNLTSSYFDRVLANPVDEHQAPAYAVEQALQFILEHGPDT